MFLKSIFIILCAFISVPSTVLTENSNKRFQILNEELQIGESHFYNIPELEKGDVLKVQVKGLSGNLDPIIGIIKAREDTQSFDEYYRSNLPESLEKGRDFAALFPSFADNYILK